MFHTTAKLFLEYLVKFDEYQPLSRENHEILIQIRTLLSFVPPLNLPESPKSASSLSTVGTDELRAIIALEEITSDGDYYNSDSDLPPDVDEALGVIYGKREIQFN